jgi:hypothetical protein
MICAYSRLGECRCCRQWDWRSKHVSFNNNFLIYAPRMIPSEHLSWQRDMSVNLHETGGFGAINSIISTFGSLLGKTAAFISRTKYLKRCPFLRVLGTSDLRALRMPSVLQSRTFRRSSWPAPTSKSTNQGTKALTSVVCTTAQTILWRDGLIHSDDRALTRPLSSINPFC